MTCAPPVCDEAAFRRLSKAEIAEASERVVALLDEAMRSFDQTLEVEPTERLVDEALALVQCRRIAGTVAARAYLLRSMIHALQGERTRAWEMFERARALDPGIELPRDWLEPTTDYAYAR
jgi:tetratricopeptide (TPR) repeat protein